MHEVTWCFPRFELFPQGEELLPLVVRKQAKDSPRSLSLLVRAPPSRSGMNRVYNPLTSRLKSLRQWVSAESTE